RRFKSPHDELLIIGDLNARVAQLQELPDYQADEQLEFLVGTPVGASNSIRGIPERHSRDPSTNNFGRALVDLCRTSGLNFLNGRVYGDMEGDITFVHKNNVGRSMIDLFVASPALYWKATTLRVVDIPISATGPKVGELLSDHCPVHLTLAVMRGSKVREVRPDSNPRPRNWRKYTGLFVAEDSSNMNKISDVFGKLGSELNATQAVDAMSKELTRFMLRAFGIDRRQHRRTREQGDAPWWTAECAAAREAMFSQRNLMRTSGTLDNADAKSVFSRLRTRYQRLRREARESYRIKHFEELLKKCKGNSHSFWRLLEASTQGNCLLSDVNDWKDYFQGLYNEENAYRDSDAEAILSFINGQHGRNGNGWEASTGQRVQRFKEATQLNEPFSLAEVSCAIHCLHNHKASGPDHVPAECYKGAKMEIEGRSVNLLVPFIHRLFEHIRSTGDYPQQFTTSYLTPIHKKGDPMDKGNYRGLAVGSALAKCYAFALERRLSRWGEAAKARSSYQGGFRSKIGTIHNLLVLRHLTDRHRTGPSSSRPLFVCQVDFEKAFDRVPRDLLWKRLHERGIHGSMLEALKSCYRKVLLRVRVNGDISDAFESCQGVKQGCPLSPTLFGFFIEGFADYVETKDLCNPKGMYVEDIPVVDSTRIPTMFYADDLNLLAHNHRRLMCVLTALGEWCSAFGMTVHTRKCEVVYFHPDQKHRLLASQILRVGLRCLDGNRYEFQEMKWVTRARYLGLYYGPDAPFESCTNELFEAGQRAMYALIDKLNRRGLFIPRIALRCFDTQIRAILSYGAQVWSPYFLSRLLDNPRDAQGRYCYFEGAMEDRMVGIQRTFLRTLASIGRVPDNRLLFREFSQDPLHLYW
ncbi:hypothetical protein Vretimale_5926, partial [Volvox reticuliferus]